MTRPVIASLPDREEPVDRLHAVDLGIRTRGPDTGKNRPTRPRQRCSAAELQTIGRADLPKVFKGDHGSALHAVADGTVVQIENSLPENHGDAQDLKFNALIEYAGNYVMLDIGGGHHACYAHCLPGSVTVRPGDRVRQGDVMARLGNSGNSTAPHLHFQICDGPDFFWAKGVPFVLDAYTKVGEAMGLAMPRQVVTRSMMEETTVFDIA